MQTNNSKTKVSIEYNIGREDHRSLNILVIIKMLDKNNIFFSNGVQIFIFLLVLFYI